MLRSNQIKVFTELRSNKENSKKYFKNLNFAYITDYLFKTIEDDTIKALHKENTLKILFY